MAFLNHFHASKTFELLVSQNPRDGRAGEEEVRNRDSFFYSLTGQIFIAHLCMVLFVVDSMLPCTGADN